jgi:hypothetical protein
MNHDELIFEINHDIETANGLSEPGLKALLAVVKLHKCSNPRFDLLCDCGKSYPCPTIQAIEKELS